MKGLCGVLEFVLLHLCEHQYVVPYALYPRDGTPKVLLLAAVNSSHQEQGTTVLHHKQRLQAVMVLSRNELGHGCVQILVLLILSLLGKTPLCQTLLYADGMIKRVHKLF
jgi:hypothetical protein